MKHLTIPTFLALAATLAAQQGTSPGGFLAAEGSDNYPYTFGYQGAGSTLNTYYTAIDATNTGPGRLIQALSVRRNATSPTNPVYQARTVTMTIRMAHGDFARVINNGINTDANLLRSAWSTVFSTKTVNLPDWTNAPGGATAPFTLVFPLDVAFPYNGADAVVFQFKCTPSNLPQLTDFPIDAEEDFSYSTSPQTQLGTGCTATGRATPMTHLSYLNNYGAPGQSTWMLVATNGPANTALLFLAGASSPNAQVGACAPLLATTTLVFTGTTNASGYGSQYLTFPHQDALVGAVVYSQGIAYDAGQQGVPFALTNGTRITYPANPTLQSFASGSDRLASASFPTGMLLFKSTAIVLGLHW